MCLINLGDHGRGKTEGNKCWCICVSFIEDLRDKTLIISLSWNWKMIIRILKLKILCGEYNYNLPENYLHILETVYSVQTATELYWFNLKKVYKDKLIHVKR